MERNEVEKNLIESIEQVEMRDFAEVWKDIEGEIQPSTKPAVKKRISDRLFYTIVSIAACLVLFCTVGIPLIVNNQPTNDIVYFVDVLTQEDVDETIFFEYMASSEVNTVNLTKYTGERFYILQADGNIVKGGGIIFYDNVDLPNYWIKLRFVSDDVKEEDQIIYDNSHTIGETVIEYKLIGQDEFSWTYKAKTTFNKVIYTMEIMALTEDVTPFFNEFFVS